MPPTPYAAETVVPVSKSKAAIESLLIDHGAEEYATGWDAKTDRIQFRLFQQTLRFQLPRPDRNDKKFTRDRRGYGRSLMAANKLYEQAERQRWRALYLVIRAKLEAVQAGISIYEQEFLSFIVDPRTDLTVGDIMVPRIQAGKGVPGLPAYTEVGLDAAGEVVS